MDSEATNMPGRNGTKDDWRPLMRQALRVVDSLVDRGYGHLDFRFGGGTVLMLRFDHRLSRDIDLFFDDAQALGFLSPRLNPIAETVARRYQEQANSVKLMLSDGDVDFIVAGTLILTSQRESMDFEGRQVVLDSTAEILAKKLLYRGATFKPRDVFDMAAALSLDAASARHAIDATSSVRKPLLRRLETLAALDQSQLMDDVRPTAVGLQFAAGMVGKLIDAVHSTGGK